MLSVFVAEHEITEETLVDVEKVSEEIGFGKFDYTHLMNLIKGMFTNVNVQT